MEEKKTKRNEKTGQFEGSPQKYQRLSKKGIPVKNASGKRPILKDFQEKIFHYLREGNSKRDAAILSGISEFTFHSWYKAGMDAIVGGYESDYIQFVQGVEEAKAQMRNFAVQNWKKGMNKDWKASVSYLERTDPENWEIKNKVEVKNETVGPQKGFLNLPDNGRRIPT